MSVTSGEKALALVGAATVLAVVLALVFMGSRAATLRRDLEQERLRAAGLQVAEESKRVDLEREVGTLRSQLEEARKVEPGIRVVEVVKWRTGATPSEGGAVAPPVQPTPGGPAGEGCLLPAGSVGEVRVEEARLVGPAGARVLVGRAEAWRLEPAPAARLFGGQLRADVALAERGARPPSWAAGLVLTAGRTGWGVGPALSPPPLQVLGLQGELVAGAGLGPGGEWQLALAGLVRW